MPLLIAIVSGVVLYAPFMQKLDFGVVRAERSTCVRWLDLRSLLGIATLVRVLVVGATGMINTWAELVIQYWEHDQLTGVLAPYKDQPPIAPAERAPIQAACEAALAQAPGMRRAFAAFPGTLFSSPRHNTFSCAAARQPTPSCCNR